jgi:hypothetical protein
LVALAVAVRPVGAEGTAAKVGTGVKEIESSIQRKRVKFPIKFSHILHLRFSNNKYP